MDFELNSARLAKKSAAKDKQKLINYSELFKARWIKFQMNELLNDFRGWLLFASCIANYAVKMNLDEAA